MSSLAILYEDNHCLALVKPAGLLTQSTGDTPSLERFAKAYLKEKYRKRGNVYLGVPHRLDRPVSGVVLFARQTVSAQRLAEQFRERQVTKRYWAIVEHSPAGEVPPAEGTWEDWVIKLPEEAKGAVVPQDTPGAKQAVLRFRRLQECDGGAWLEVEPVTGRMHQIRIQAAARGWPVWGDVLYGARTPFGPATEVERDRVIALHARSLTFLHPVRYEALTLTAPVSADWPATQEPAS